MSEADSLTDLIRRAQDGDEAALRVVFDATYVELRGLARSRLRKGSRNTLLDTTSLVHEAYLRFADAGRLHIGDRQHFLRYASHVMRSVIVDFVRERIAQRRGGDAVHVTLNSEIGDATRSPAKAKSCNVHEALEELAQHDARLVQVVEMRYFAGMTEMEIAAALGVNDRTVRRDWQKARCCWRTRSNSCSSGLSGYRPRIPLSIETGAIAREHAHAKDPDRCEHLGDVEPAAGRGAGTAAPRSSTRGSTICRHEFDGLKPRLRELLSRTALVETDEFLHTLPKLELEPGDLAAAPRTR